jgi:hypothetical protein
MKEEARIACLELRYRDAAHNGGELERVSPARIERDSD